MVLWLTSWPGAKMGNHVCACIVCKLAENFLSEVVRQVVIAGFASPAWPVEDGEQTYGNDLSTLSIHACKTETSPIYAKTRWFTVWVP
jgi:hypothetical protein